MEDIIKAEKEVVLNYIDKVAIALQKVGERKDSFIKWTLLVCFALVLLTTGQIQTSNKFDFVGINVTFSYPLLMIVACITINYFFIQCVGLIYAEQEFFELIIRLYDTLDYYDISMDRGPSLPMVYQGYISMSMRSEIYGNNYASYSYQFFISFIMLLSSIVLPVVIQVITFIKLVVIVGSTWWLLSLISILTIVSLVSIIMMFKHGADRKKYLQRTLKKNVTIHSSKKYN